MSVGRPVPIVVSPVALLTLSELGEPFSVTGERLQRGAEIRDDRGEARVAGQVRVVLPVDAGDGQRDYVLVCHGASHAWASGDCLTFAEAAMTPCWACRELQDGGARFTRLKGRF